jgi:hypothetical protein
VKRNNVIACLALATLVLISGCGGGVASKSAAGGSSAATDRWPLTGEAAPKAPTEPALSVKIDNAPAAHPQSGLNQADLVFECLVEGGMTRFLAVFQSQSAAVVGPIRSARPVDGALLRALNGGIFAYSGAATGEIAPAKAYSTAFLISDDDNPVPFWRTTASAPGNVYSSTAKLRAEAARKSAHPGLPSALFTYGPVVPGSSSARRVSVVVGRTVSASWVYSGASYLRSENGSPHLLANGQQVRTTNVVVLRVKVTHSGIMDAAGNEDPFVLAYGSGAAEVFRNGVVEHGLWSRPSVTDAYKFTSTAGGALPLSPGPSWIELVPESGSVSPG